MNGFVGQMLAVAGKDLRLEFRSRERLVTMITFAALVAVVFSFALDPTVRARGIIGAMLWVTVLFAGTLGLGRSFTLEREQEALTGVLLTPVDRGALYLGKFLANLVILLLVEAVIFPVFALFFQASFARSLQVFLNGRGIATPDMRGVPVVDDSFLLLFNGHHDRLTFTLPPDAFGARWEVVLDTDTVTGDASVMELDGDGNGRPERLGAGSTRELVGRSMLVLREVTA